jgi:hypothetical protein
MIVFVVLWLISTVAFIVLFTKQEDLNALNIRLEADNQRLIKPQERDAMGAYYTRAEPSGSVVGVIEQERKDTLQLVSADAKDYVGARQESDAALEAIAASGLAPEVSASDPLLSVLSVVFGKLTQLDENHTETMDANQRLTAEAANLSAKLQETQAAFDTSSAALTEQLTTTEEKNQAYRDEKDRQITDLNKQIGAIEDQHILALRKKEDEADKLRSRNAQLEKINAAQQARLAENRPPVDPTRVAWQADGKIVRALPGDLLVYINLGRKDKLLLGLRFQVYSPTRGPAPDGSGKATIKVVALYDETAECTIETNSVEDPIIQGDLIANAIYDRDRKFTFLVAGGFDLDFNGSTDRDGTDRIVAMVEKWGGRIVTQLSENTDFVVIGTRPPIPLIGADADANRQERARGARADAAAFDALKQDVRALSIPMLTQAQFLAFIGYSVGAPSPIDF